MRTSIGRTAALIAGTAALALGAGCGGDDGDSGSGGDDAADIEAVVTKAITTLDVEEKCVETVTTGFVSTVYGSLAQCKKAEAPEPDDDPPPTGAAVSGVKVDGDKATATVATKGGDADGASGTISFAKEDGDWKVSDLGVDYLRSQLVKGLEQGEFDESDGPLADPAARECVSKGLSALDDTAFKKLAYSAIADAEPDAEFVRVITECASGTGTDAGDDTGGEADTEADAGDEDISLLRKQFESGIRQSALKDDATPEQIDCVLKKLRTEISEDDIVAAVGQDKAVTDELTQKTAKAIQGCG
jgi:hypothetical protein